MLATVADVEERYDEAFTAAEQNAVEVALEVASQTIVDYVGAPIEPTAQVDTLNVLQSDWRITTRFWPIIQLTQVRIRNSGVAAWTILTEDVDFVVVNDAMGRIHRIRDRGTVMSWPVGYKTVEFTYSSGYDPIPASIRDVAVNLAYRTYSAGQSGESQQVAAGTIASERIGEYAVSYATGSAAAAAASVSSSAPGRLSAVEVSTLNQFRRPVLV